MKFLRLLPVAAIACLAVSCQNGGTQLENASQTDSLMYYLGQMHATDYLREANRDTVMKENSEKQAYLAGVRTGLSLLKDGDETYNKGVMMGLQMANQMISFSEQMKMPLNKSAYINSLSSALMADSMPNNMEVQSNFRKVMNNIQEAKEAADKAQSQESLKAVAEAAGLPKISDDLYGKVTQANNDTTTLAKGDEITLDLKVTKENGDPVNLPMSPKGKIGRGYPEILTDAILKLKSGETGEYMTSAHALLGARAAQMNMEPTEVLKFTVTPTLVPKEPQDAPADKKDDKK